MERSVRSLKTTVADTEPIMHECPALSKRDEHRVQENINFVLNMLESMPRKVRELKMKDFLRLPVSADRWQTVQKRRLELEFARLGWS